MTNRVVSVTAREGAYAFDGAKTYNATLITEHGDEIYIIGRETRLSPKMSGDAWLGVDVSFTLISAFIHANKHNTVSVQAHTPLPLLPLLNP